MLSCLTPAFGEVILQDEGTSEGGLVLKGTKIITFTSTVVEGSAEGMTPGTTLSRDESLKLNISGRAADTDVDANIISTTSTTPNVIAEQQDKVSILLRRASTEAYWGDFTANFNDVEFASLSKELSGLRVSGDYGNWGFKAIAATPKGESKNVRLYGDGTQGPYPLGFSPVVVNSEHVRVDGVEQNRGEDYDIDYEGGTVTFRKRTIISTSVIDVDYDWRETPYEHSTYGLRIVDDISSDLRLGATYINDSDSIAGAADALSSMTSNPIYPISHYVLGFDGTYAPRQEFNSDFEFAYSERNPNLLAPSTQEIVNRDSAFKVDTSSVLGPLLLQTRVKRIGPAFQSIGDALPKQDLSLVGGDISYEPNSVFHTDASLNNESYDQGGARYENNGVLSRTKMGLADWPSLTYVYSQLIESSDPVTGVTIERTSVRDFAEADYRSGFLNHVLTGSYERRTDREPSEEATVYKILGYGVGTVGLENLSASGNLELKETELPDGETPLTKTYIVNLSASPAREYFVSLGLNHVDDSMLGVTTVTDLGFRATPVREVYAEGKYTMSSIKEDFGATPEAVLQQVGSFRIDFRPLPELRLRHTFKPNFTTVQGLGVISYNSNSNQSEINWAPLNVLSIGEVYRVDDLVALDKSAVPLGRVGETGTTKSANYTIKSAPLQFLSVELNYTYDDIASSTLISTEPLSYASEAGTDKNFTATVRTSLSELFSVDSGYTNLRQNIVMVGSGESIDSLTQTGTLKVTYNINDSWSIYGSTAYSETFDDLSTTSPYTYSISPGLGFIYRIANALRVEGSYTYSRSYAGAATEKSVYDLKTKYDMNAYVHMSANIDQQQSIAPDYKVTQFLGNVEIDL